MAKAFAAEGIRVEKYSQIKDAVVFALNCGKPCVIDMIIATDPIPPPVAGAWREPVRGWVSEKPREKR